jgi:putative salt-induced outer membrane protein YdiY
MRATLSRLTLLLLGVVLTPDCLADTIILDNGDRITGKIQRSEPGKVVVLTDYAGEIKIDWQHIATLTADQPMTVQFDDDTRVYGNITGGGSTLRITPADGGPDRSVEVTRVENLFPGEQLHEKMTLSGRVNVGTSQTTGNTHTSTTHLDAELEARKTRDRYTMGGYYNRAADQGVETASNAKLYGKYDHFFTKKWYSSLNASVEHDRFADIEVRTTSGVGLGYQVFESTPTNLSLEAGLDYVYADRYQQPTESYPTVRLAAKFDHYLIPDRLQFFYFGEVYIGQGDDEPSFANSETGLRMPIFGNFLATLQYNVHWNAHPASGFVRTDKMLLFSLGYHW